MIILGISCYYHDAAAAIIIDGNVMAAALEERFTRIKHDNQFPKKAIDFCLKWLELDITDVDVVSFYEKPIVKFDRIVSTHMNEFPKSRKVFIDSMGSWFDTKLKIRSVIKKEIGFKGDVVFFPHHLSHAAGTYYPSGYQKAAIVTVDGVGEWATTTIGVGMGSEIRIDKEIHFPHSLGLLYSAITTYLGFAANNDEYKVMGLAAYGDPKPFYKTFDELITLFSDGSFALNMKYFDYAWADHMVGKKLESLFGHPKFYSSPERVTGEKVRGSLPAGRQGPVRLEIARANIAASLQAKLEEALFSLMCAAYKTYHTNNLCFSGGVALNSVANGKIAMHTPFRNIYIPPDPGDGGGAIGSALLAWRYVGKGKSWRFDSPYLGPAYTDENIKDILEKNNLSYQTFDDRSKLLDHVSDLIIKQKIIGWFQGRMEWGPRALGSRSILASATKEKMKDIINSKVKHREMFRPFAPAILSPYVDQYFIKPTSQSRSEQYMLMVYPFTEKGKRDVPATVHVDGTGRLQVVYRQNNPLYYDLIDAYRKKTGIPIIINTSFNVRYEPIVCTPQDAVSCFLGTDIDYLVIGKYIVKKD
jgi:carbamoyltransferase